MSIVLSDFDMALVLTNLKLIADAPPDIRTACIMNIAQLIRDAPEAPPDVSNDLGEIGAALTDVSQDVQKVLNLVRQIEITVGSVEHGAMTPEVGIESIRKIVGPSYGS